MMSFGLVRAVLLRRTSFQKLYGPKCCLSMAAMPASDLRVDRSRNALRKIESVYDCSASTADGDWLAVGTGYRRGGSPFERRAGLISLVAATACSRRLDARANLGLLRAA